MKPLATCNNLKPNDKEAIFNELNGRALNIAKVMFGEKSSKDVKCVANGFVLWAKSLKVR